MTEKQKNIINKALHDDKKVHVSFGNSKIGKIMNFSLMPIWTCSKEACATCAKGGCYALKENRYPAVLYNRVQNTWLAQQNIGMLEVGLIDSINKHKPSVIRLHEAGDFVNVDYLKMWVRIARRYPEITIYTYTKQFDNVRACAKDVLAKQNLSILLSAWKGLEVPADLVEMGFKVAYISDCENISGDAVQCLNQLDKTITCDKCGLCWQGKNIVFKKH